MDHRLRRRQLLRNLSLSLLGVAATAALGWFLYQDFSGRRDAGAAGTDARDQTGIATRGETPRPVGRGQPPDREARDPNRTTEILRCTAPDGSTFYTNARTCEAADLDQRVNVVPGGAPQRSAADPQDSWDAARSCLADRLRGERELRLLPACREPFTKALELERNLARSDDPVDSRRAGEYCDLIAEGARAGCPATSDVFCYLAVCQRRVER